jgi:hypothetical protein
LADHHRSAAATIDSLRQPQGHPALLREISVDREKMSETWSEWEATASAKLAELRERGLDIRKVDVDVRELQAWCERGHRPIDGAARSEFVVEQLRRRAMVR